jgi:hypothetical protein
MSEDFLAALEAILQDGQVPQETINRIVVALALDAGSQVQQQGLETGTELAELKRMMQEQSENIRALTAVVERHEAYIQTHPSLLFLLRFRTKETAVAVVLVFLLLSIWYVSGFRQPILNFLGLPIF